MDSIRAQKTKISERIQKHRSGGELAIAISVCEDAVAKFPADYFYRKILGDLYFQQKDFDLAIDAYANFLDNIRTKPSLFRDFARRYNRVIAVCNAQQKVRFRKVLTDIVVISYREYDPLVIQQVTELIPGLILNSHDLSNKGLHVISLLENDLNSQQLPGLLRSLEESNKIELLSILNDFVLQRTNRQQTLNIDTYAISLYERFELYNEALKIAREILPFRMDPVVVRSIFRICRKIGDYTVAKNIMSTYRGIENSNTFNVMYELVYFYEYSGDMDSVRNTLTRMEKMFTDSIPINRTLRNFYVRFGMLDNVEKIDKHLKGIRPSKRSREEDGNARFRDEITESEQGIGSKIRDLYSELEHQKQLAAISELTTGISHELGQPITNIRYTIQFYRKQLERELDRGVVFNVFDSILQETERMGGLVKRLAPLTSSKSASEYFDIVERIQKRINAEMPRLQSVGIGVDFPAQPRVVLFGDPVKFDQVISNLLINAIYAIQKRTVIGKNVIRVRVRSSTKNIIIEFCDTGVGIPHDDRSKIFDPFFSTKPPGEGEGLGLFIVWNVLKSQGGTIKLDSSYNNGARFIITLPKRSEQGGKSDFTG